MPQSSAVGEFEGHGDIGDVGIPGSAEFDGVYTLSGSGYNMWFAEDAFHYVWKRVQGDVYLAADVAFLGDGTDPHRKACLVIRQSLDADSACAYIAVHGDGLTSLQYRDAKGETTHEVQSNVTKPTRVGIERRGAYVSAAVDGRPSGGSVRLDLQEPFYIGLGVCSHVKDVVETATFSKVATGTVVPGRTGLYSTLETVDIASTDRRTVRVFKDHIEAPNWTADDRLIYNSGGLLYSIPVAGGSSNPIDTDFAERCNNDHGISPDGTQIVISDQSETGQSIIYTLPIEGGEPVRITEKAPSYWHGWCPDGKTLAYCAQRDGKFGIFTIPAEGGRETRLTTADSLDDGPDYSPDGQHIYFNSDRTGLMQIFRMKTDGSEQTRITNDGWGDWFPHISPDGRWMVFLSYAPDVKGHPPDKDVMLRLMDLQSGEIKVLAKLFGGQGTINVPSWSPDSKHLAFVSYQYL